MSIFDIFRKKANEISGNEIGDLVSGVNNINKFDFIGNTSKSDNERFTVGFRDLYYEEDKPINGEIILIENNEFKYRKKFIRPNDAIVSNSGIVVFCDWLESNQLNGDFIILDLNGEIIYKKNVEANLGICSISFDSSIALFETFSSDNDDSNKIFVIDVFKRNLISAFSKEFRFKNIKIDTQLSQIYFINDNDILIYDFWGNLKNAQEIEDKLFNSTNIPKHIAYLYNLCFENCQQFIDNQNYLKYLDNINEQINEIEIWQRRDLAKVYKCIGDFFESKSDLSNAIIYFEKALELDKKVGLKRKLDKLKK
jgi:tetratricopeptide (TPR) repeat protein